MNYIDILPPQFPRWLLYRLIGMIAIPVVLALLVLSGFALRAEKIETLLPPIIGLATAVTLLSAIVWRLSIRIRAFEKWLSGLVTKFKFTIHPPEVFDYSVDLVGKVIKATSEMMQFARKLPDFIVTTAKEIRDLVKQVHKLPLLAATVLRTIKEISEMFRHMKH